MKISDSKGNNRITIYALLSLLLFLFDIFFAVMIIINIALSIAWFLILSPLLKHLTFKFVLIEENHIHKASTISIKINTVISVIGAIIIIGLTIFGMLKGSYPGASALVLVLEVFNCVVYFTLLYSGYIKQLVEYDASEKNSLNLFKLYLIRNIYLIASVVIFFMAGLSIFGPPGGV